MHIVMLSTYPTLEPLHGGQHRVANMITALRARGHQVRSVGVLGSDHYPKTPDFLPFPGYKVLTRYIDNAFLMEDWAIGELAHRDSAVFASLTKLVGSPDAIFCEQPWLFAFAQRLRDSLKRKKPKLIYSSHNIESRLKREIVERHFDADRSSEIESLVLATEQNAIENADLIFSVSETDAEWTRHKAAVPVIVAPNGVNENRASVQDVVAANKLTGHRKYALYVASAHPPNMTGFYDIFGAGVGCVSPEERLIVAGSAGRGIRDDSRFGTTAGLEKCFVDAGNVNDSQLRGLLHNAHCIILPMTSGGGTNLKTAEALWSGRPVIATEIAMRGFEAFADYEGVRVCRTKSQFLRELQRCLAEPRANHGSSQLEKRRSLLWDSTLTPIVDAFAGVVN